MRNDKDQWHIVGFLRQRQEVKLAPLFLIFLQNSKMVDPKPILVIFKVLC